jgi:thymidylate synthase ThyX
MDPHTMSNRQSEPLGGPDVYCIVGVDPEVHAYAMAKYSRSALSMRQSLRELSQQRAEQFLNTFYFQYGHRSIADLAHISFAVERLSMLAAIAVVDEQKWDGQERSSRYQDFKKSGYYIPEVSPDLRHLFVSTIARLFNEYEILSEASLDHLCRLVPKPPDMAGEAYRRTLRARAFDIARYVLPLATNTSVGQIVSARTLENQIARLAADPHPEVRQLAARLKEAAKSPPYNLRLEQLLTFFENLRNKSPDVDLSGVDDFLSNAPVAPTLVKYAEARAFDEATRTELLQASSELLRNVAIAPAAPVSLVRPATLDVEIAASLIYEHSHHPYAQIVALISDLPAHTRKEIIEVGIKHRGPYDEISRPFAAGQQFQFDILMDIGGFRDMHRHRRCIQILQPYTNVHGYSMPEQVSEVHRETEFRSLMDECGALWNTFAGHEDKNIMSASDYVLPLAFRRRALFKMDFAEVLYICELRSGPAGHFSYRRIAFDMYKTVDEREPELAKYIRVHDVNEPIDLLRR